MWWVRWWYVHLACLIIIYVILKKNIDKKLDKSDGADDDIYILYVR
jgi:hypothetical protein